jgi:hypothetical protein
MAGLGFGLWFFFGNAWYAIRYVRSHAAHTFSRSLAMTWPLPSCPWESAA